MTYTANKNRLKSVALDLTIEEQQSLGHFLKVFTLLNLIGLLILGIFGWLYLLM